MTATIGAMRRRHLLSFTAAGPLALLSACASAQPSYTVSLRQMQQALDGRFPRSYPVAGLLDLQLQTPRLALLPERNQINAVADVQASGPLLRRSHGGTFDVDFALRYEPSDRTLRAHDLRVNALCLDGLKPQAAQALALYGQQLADQSLREVVLHQLQPKDLALADGLGVQPESITVTPQGLVVRFGNKPRP